MTKQFIAGIAVLLLLLLGLTAYLMTQRGFAISKAKRVSVDFSNEQFSPFSGKYPEHWPRELTLPDNSYILGSSEIMEDKVEAAPDIGFVGSHGFSVTLAAVMTSFELLTQMTDEFKALGSTVTVSLLEDNRVVKVGQSKSLPQGAFVVVYAQQHVIADGLDPIAVCTIVIY